MRFIGGVLDGKEFEVDEPYLNVPVENGQWVDPANGIVKEWQVYVKNGDVYELSQ